VLVTANGAVRAPLGGAHYGLSGPAEKLARRIYSTTQNTNFNAN
jgi:hypothetical protein